jgi:hypothetical protein
MSLESNEIEKEVVETPEFVVEKVDDGTPSGIFEVSVEAEEDVVTTPVETPETPEQPVETPTEPTPEVIETPEMPIETPEAPTEDNLAPQVTIDENTVKSFLKEQYGIEADSLEDLKPKEQKQLSALAEKLQEFIEKTGNENIQDFLETQRDWSQEDESTRLMAYLQIENPDLTQQQLDFLFKKKYSYDAEYDDEEVVMEKQISQKQDLRKADALLEQRKQEFMVKRGSDNLPEDVREKLTQFEQIAQEQKSYQDAIARQQQAFVAKTNELFTDNFEGFKVTVDGKEYKIKPQDVVATKTKQTDVGNIINKYFDKETGLITDPVGYHKALFFADNPELAAKHFIEIGRAEEAERAERESKNITMDTKQIPQSNSKPAFVVEKVS